MPPDAASCLLCLDLNISEASRLMFPLLASLAPPYGKVLYWLQLSYTGDRLGAYIAPGATELKFSNLAEGGGAICYSTVADSDRITKGIHPGAYIYGCPPQD